MITVSNITKVFGKKKAVDAISFTIKKGEIVGFLGPNGAGKTTTFYMVVGLVAPDSGMVELDGNNIARLPIYERARLGLGYLLPVKPAEWSLPFVYQQQLTYGGETEG
jgi:lipopolysaccharide export system ATP-binding protein